MHVYIHIYTYIHIYIYMLICELQRFCMYSIYVEFGGNIYFCHKEEDVAVGYVFACL